MAPRLEDLLDDVVTLPDPVERFRALAELDDPVREFASRIRAERVRAVREMRGREPRPSWAEIGAELGVTGARAQQLANDTTKETE